MTNDQLIGRFEIMDCIHRYCHAVDRRRWSLMDSVFHADATYKFFSIEGSWRDFVAQAKGLIDPIGPTHHQVSNITVRFDGDTAYSETYLRAFHSVPVDYPPWNIFSLPGGGNILIGGRYIDRFERRDGEWRIAHRHGLLDWRQDLKADSGGLDSVDPTWRGQFGAADPSLKVMEPWL
ncbi:MAG: hypothetical protein JWO15_2272 [Sphingomonadales bacterium]|nr:hypothetical protein [Sphingomonadales bacterium]